MNINNKLSFITILIFTIFFVKFNYSLSEKNLSNQKLSLQCKKRCSIQNGKLKKFCKKCISFGISYDNKIFKNNKISENEIKFLENRKIHTNNELDDKIYVSFTSWTKRIQNCKHTIDLMMKQTLLPSKIILNLSEEEFPNKENELPEELVQEVKRNELFEIFWIKENTTVFKKIIPTMNRFPNDLVLSIDDDIEYPNFYIEEMYKTYLKYNKLFPIVGFSNRMKSKLYLHSGPFTLTSKRFYSNYLDDIYNNLILTTLSDVKWQSDMVYSYALLVTGNRYKRCFSIDGNTLYKQSKLNTINAYSNYKDSNYPSRLKKNIKMLDNYVKEKYNKSYMKILY